MDPADSTLRHETGHRMEKSPTTAPSRYTKLLPTKDETSAGTRANPTNTTNARKHPNSKPHTITIRKTVTTPAHQNKRPTTADIVVN
jgi:hypothetical protein